MGNPCKPLTHPPHLLSEEQRKLAEAMIGCGSADTDWLEDLTIAQLEEVDNIVFMCAGCGWWCAAEECNEYNDDWYCDDCVEEDKP